MLVTIIGAGAFGTALASILEENGHKFSFFDPKKFPEISLKSALESSDAIVFSAGMNQKLAPLAEGHATVSRVIPISPDESIPQTDRVLPFDELMRLGTTEASENYHYPVLTDLDRMVEMDFPSVHVCLKDQ